MLAISDPCAVRRDGLRGTCDSLTAVPQLHSLLRQQGLPCQPLSVVVCLILKCRMPCPADVVGAGSAVPVRAYLFPHCWAFKEHTATQRCCTVLQLCNKHCNRPCPSVHHICPSDKSNSILALTHLLVPANHTLMPCSPDADVVVATDLSNHCKRWP